MRLRNATKRPSPEMHGSATVLVPSLPWTCCAPLASVLTRTSEAPLASYRKMSQTPLVSPLTRSLANDQKAIRAPSAEMDGLVESKLPWATSVLVPLVRS